MKILLLDIETSPNTAHVWGLYNQNVGLNQLMESSYVMCWAAKWLGEKEVHFSSMMETTHRKMIKKIYKLLDEADAVIHYNGTKFDIPTLNKEFLLLGLTPPSPYKEIDLLRTSRSKFKFPSNKLDYVAQALGLGEKVKHIGHELWIRCMNKDKQAWDMMKKYNIQDVVLLEKVYEKMLSWIRNHPNQNGYHAGVVCPNCGGSNLIKRGLSCNTNTVYQRLRCKDCGKWSRSNKQMKDLKKLESAISI
jgi:DNA polymerase elongation subunit (family B)